MPTAVIALAAGIPYHFPDDAVPALNDVSPPVAVPRKGTADGGRRITWGAKFAAAPATLSFRLQGTACPDDTDPAALGAAFWFDIDNIVTVVDQVRPVDIPKNVTHLRTFIQAITGAPTGLRAWVLT